MKKIILAILTIILVSTIFSIAIYPALPEKSASHWNINGEVNGYMPRFWAAFLMPIISIVLLAILFLIPKLDPLKTNIKKFEKYFDRFILLLMIFLFYIHILTTSWNIGYKFNMVQFISPAFAALFYYIGVLIGVAKRNWSIGIRTLWTLSSDEVWNKTHALGSKLFKSVGLISLIGVVLPSLAIYLILIPTVLITIYIITYSYVEYRKIKHTKKIKKNRRKK